MGENIKEIIKELTPYLEKAAEQLGVTAQYLWGLQVKQAYVVGVSLLLTTAIWLAVSVILSVILCKQYKAGKCWDKYGDISPSYFFMFLGVMVLDGVVMLNVTQDIRTLITLLVNPEYWALNEVVKVLKGNIKL